MPETIEQRKERERQEDLQRLRAFIMFPVNITHIRNITDLLMMIL